MMVDITTEISIHASIEEVAAFASNPDNAPQWYVNIKSVVWKTAKPLRIGSRVAFIAEFLSKELPYTYEVMEFSDHKFLMKTAEGAFPMGTTYTFEAEKTNVTTMTLRNKGEPQARRVQVLGTMMRGSRHGREGTTGVPAPRAG